MSKRFLTEKELEELLYTSEEDDLVSELEDHLSEDVQSESNEDEDITTSDYADTNTVVTSKNGTIKWNSEPANQQERFWMANIIRIKSGLTR